MILVSRSKKRIIALKGYGIKITKQEIIKWKKKYVLLNLFRCFKDDLKISLLKLKNIFKIFVDITLTLGVLLEAKLPFVIT